MVKNKKIDINIDLINRALVDDCDRDCSAIIACYGFTFEDDIQSLKDYAIENNYPLVVKAIDGTLTEVERKREKRKD